MSAIELHVALSEKVRNALEGTAPYTSWYNAYTTTQKTLLEEEGKLGIIKVPPPTTVPLALLRSVLQNEVGRSGVGLHAVLRGETIRPVIPPNADPSRREYRAKLRKARDKMEQRQYDAMVHGSSSRRNVLQQPDMTMGQMFNEAGMALDMRLTTLGVAVAGYAIPYSIGWSKNLCWLGAVLGLVISLFVEAVLLIIRVNKFDKQERKKKEKER